MEKFIKRSICYLICIWVLLIWEASGFAYDYYESGYLGDLSTDWGILGGRNHQPNCVDIPEKLTLCRGIGYTNMTLPNLLDHETLAEVVDQARVWVPLLNLHCHPDTQLFLCSLYAPLCIVPPIYPCRSLCEGVKRGCEDRINNYGYPWPEILRCDKFPESGLCMKQVTFEDTANVCRACRHPLTYESLLDNYCWSSYVIKVKVRKTIDLPNGDRELVLKGKKAFYKPKPNTLSKAEIKAMKLVIPGGARCDCDTITKKSGKILIMSSRQNDRFEVTYISEWSKNKAFKRAVRAIRKGNDCKTQIDQIAGQTDANNGGISTGGKPIIPVEEPIDNTTQKKKKNKGKKDKGKKKGKKESKEDPMENFAGIGCIPCKQPLVYQNLVEKYCEASFVAKIKVKKTSIEENGDKKLITRRLKGDAWVKVDDKVVSKKDRRKFRPVISGGSSCDCVAADSDKKTLFIMGVKQGGRLVINYLSELVKDSEFKRFLRAIRKDFDCSGVSPTA